MLNVTFAFVVATALLFIFPSTRALGVVGVFLLLCINPVVFGGLLLAVAVGYCVFAKRDQASRLLKVLPRRSSDAKR